MSVSSAERTERLVASASVSASASSVSSHQSASGLHLYRSSGTGLALLAALRRMRTDRDITDSQYNAIVAEFDTAFQDNLQKQLIASRLSIPVIEASLDNYNILNGDYRLDGSKVSISLQDKAMITESIHVDCIDKKYKKNS